MAKLFVVSLLLVVLALMLYWNGNILVFGGEYPQVCIGWPDDTVFSWWCTADLTVREAR